MDKKITQEWDVYNLYLSSAEQFDEVIESLCSYAKSLIEKGDLAGFYYNKYNVPPNPPYLRFGCYRIKAEVVAKIDDLIKQGKITSKESTSPDLTDVDGVVMDRIKLTARKITEVIKDDFKQALTVKQTFYLIHLSMNHFFGYMKEREIYSALTKSMEEALKKTTQKKK
jgi:hypothetical protein